LIPAELSVTTENWPWTFRVYSLGKFRILKNDQPLGFLSKLQLKPMELLKAIIAFGGEDIPEDQIAASLWPRIEGDYAHRSLTTTLHRLRKMLGENGGVVLQHGRISLSKQFWWLDTWALEKVFVEIDNLFRLSTRRVPEEKVTQLAEQIFSLYHGPFMSSESGHPWHVSLQEQLRNKFLRYMGDLGRYREDKQQWDIAIQYYQRGLEVDALAEGFCRRLMLCYREIGRRAEAIEAYESCKKTLQALQKTEPSPETTAIYENLLHEI